MITDVAKLEAKISHYKKAAEAAAHEFGLKYDDLQNATTYWGEKTVHSLDRIYDETALNGYYLSKVAITTESYLTTIAQYLRIHVVQMDQLIHLVANPSSTRGAEQRQWGINALGNHHLPEAVRDLEGAVAENPYDVKAYYALGIAHTVRGEYDKAGENFQWAARYSSPSKEDPSLAATAAILGASCYDKALQPQLGWQLLLDTWKTTDCPDLALLLAERARDNIQDEKQADKFLRQALIKAFLADGTLVLEAEMIQADQLELVAKDAMQQRYIDELEDLEEAFRTLLNIYKAYELEKPSSYRSPSKKVKLAASYESNLANAVVRHAQLRRAIRSLANKLRDRIDRKIELPMVFDDVEYPFVETFLAPIATICFVGAQLFPKALPSSLRGDNYGLLMWGLLGLTIFSWGMFNVAQSRLEYPRLHALHIKSVTAYNEAARATNWQFRHREEIKSVLSAAYQVLGATKSPQLPRAFATLIESNGAQDRA